jgi:intraflagellar transport protein 80
LFITILRRSRARLAKLGTMVQSLVWHEDHSMLAAISNNKLVVWYNPSAAFVDPELLDRVRSDRDGADFGKNPVIANFSNSGCTIARADGATMSAGVSPYPSALHKYVSAKGSGKGAWDNAIRLCRFVKDAQMWACLASMAAGAKELDAAEIAYAAIDEVDKVQYIAHIKTIPTVEGRDAEMALFCRESDEAEAILLQAGLIFRAIEMNCLLFRWERALDLAVKNRTHIDTVLAWREQNLVRMRATETNIKFQQYAQGVEIDWDKIKAKIEQEAENERSRPGAVPYV